MAHHAGTAAAVDGVGMAASSTTSGVETTSGGAAAANEVATHAILLDFVA
jgi:hypothetical protein